MRIVNISKQKNNLDYSYLDDHHLDGDVFRQTNGSSEVLRQRHQQVQDSHDTLRMNS